MNNFYLFIYFFPFNNWIEWSFLVESAQQTLSTAQILSIFPVQPVGGSPYSSPSYSPTTMPWGQQGPQGNQWGGHWPTMPGSTPAWAPPGPTVNPAGGQLQAHTIVNPQPGFMVGGSTIGSPATPSPIYGYPTPLNSAHTPNGTTGALGSPSLDNNLLLWWAGYNKNPLWENLNSKMNSFSSENVSNKLLIQFMSANTYQLWLAAE